LSGDGPAGDAGDSSAAEKLRREAFDEFLTAWEAEHGELTSTDLADARRRLGLSDSSAA